MIVLCRGAVRRRLEIGALLAAAGVAALASAGCGSSSGAPAVSVSTAHRNAAVARDGWAVRLRGAGPRHGTLTLSSPGTKTLGDARLRALIAQPGVHAGEAVEIGLVGGALGRRGAVLRRTLSDPLPVDSRAVLAYYDAHRRVWRAVPTSLSADRRRLVARVHHFSTWDDIEYGAGWLLDGRADPPTCAGPLPRWVSSDGVVFLDDKNAPLRWCVGHDPRNGSVLVVKLVVNRSYGVAVHTALAPSWTYDSLFGAGPKAFTTELLARSLAVPAGVRGTFGGQVPLMPGLEVNFGFTEAQARRVTGSSLVHVSLDATDALLGSAYDAIKDVAADEGIVGRQVAAVTAMVAIAQCMSDVGHPLVKRKWWRLARGAVKCVTDNAEDIAKTTASVLVARLPNVSPRVIGRIAGKAVGRLALVVAAAGAFQVGTWVADRRLDAAAFELHVYPRIVRRPPPVVRPKPQAPASVPSTPNPPTSSLTPGSPFQSKCVVAWPTAPTRTSQSIEMTMSCSAVPESEYLFTHVTYGDPNFKITPSTGPVEVTGRVVDVARSEYGYSELIVEADSITTG